MSKPTTSKGKVPTRTLFWTELVCSYCNETTAGQYVASKVPIRSSKPSVPAGCLRALTHSAVRLTGKRGTSNKIRHNLNAPASKRVSQFLALVSVDNLCRGTMMLYCDTEQ